MTDEDKRKAVDDWKAANGYDDLLSAYSAAVDALTAARRERDEARETNRRLNLRCQQYERALAERVSLCPDGKPKGSALSRSLLNGLCEMQRADIERLTAERDEGEQRGRAAERADVLATFEHTRIDACARYEEREHELSDDGRQRVATAVQGGLMLLDELKGWIEAGRHVGAAGRGSDG